MLGCKLGIVVSVAESVSGINRYMLGCKYRMGGNNTADGCELIDTCWDVNTIYIIADILSIQN